MAAKIPAVVAYAPELVQELSQRISASYGRAPALRMMGCTKTPMKSGCKRRAFVVALDPDRCAALLAEDFDGCAVVFCMDS